VKHKLITVLLLIFILSGSSLFSEATQSEFYVKTIFIVRVFNNNLGFRVDYQTANMKIHSTYMPVEWFGFSGGYGEVIYGDHPSAPYMSIWYKDDKIDHFRLYVKKDYTDPSWGPPRVLIETEDYFTDEELTIAYE
jgi:hypothetical protein